MRQNLLKEGKTSKYFKYAIGEIILVVIGILIALQINNWNENRKENAFELQLLYSFKTGLQKDLADLDGNVKWHRRGIFAVDSILYALENDVTYDINKIASHFSKAMTPTYFQYSTSAFETLKSKGITIISNRDLREEIIGVFDSQYNFFLQNQMHHIEEIERGYTQVFSSRFKESYKYDLTKSDFPGSLMPIDFESLKNDHEFLYYLKSLKNRTIILVDWQYKLLRNRIVNLIEKIELEINYLYKK